MTEQPDAHLDAIEGEVKWFDPRKGYGFIVGPEGQDIFAHYTVIEGDGFRVLRDGALVTYSAERSNKGWKATRVERVAEEPEIRTVRREPFSRSPRR
ncbi:MAG: cold shock domain-containing protein [Planctomycetota bacterium]